MFEDNDENKNELIAEENIGKNIDLEDIKKNT